MRSDVIHALRALRASPSFTVVSLLVLTLGIGATTAIFSVVDGVALRNLPFHEPDRLVSIADIDTQPQGFTGGHTTAQDYLDWVEGQSLFEGIAAVTGGGFTVRDGGFPENLPGTRTTANLFSLLRVSPQLGRLFTTEHEVEGRHQVALISHGLWQRRFGGDPDVVGKMMAFDSGPREILGVMPEGFEYPVGATRPAEIWVPYVIPASERVRANSRNYGLLVVGRLKPDATLAQAGQQMQAIHAGIREKHPQWAPTREIRVRTLHESLVGRVRGWMLMLLGAVAFVMVIACVNVANLFLARATTRARDVGIRSALGASRWQLIRGVLVESLVLSVIGTVLGVLVAQWGIEALKSLLPASLPRAREIGLDLRVLGAAAAAAVSTGILCGIAPAWQLTRPDVAGALRDGGRSQTPGAGRQRLRSMLVVSEVALAVILLVGAGLFVSSFLRVTRIDVGLDVRNVLTVPVYPPFVFSDEGQRAAGMARAELLVPQAIERVRQVPGVTIVGAIANGLPLSGSWSRTNVTVPGSDLRYEGAESVDIRSVSTEYFEAAGIRLLRGRLLEDADRTGAPVVVLSEEAARVYLPGRDPIGARITINGERTVVGVVGSVRLGGPESEVRPEAYRPFEPGSMFGADLIVKTIGPPEALAPVVRSAIREIAPDLTLGETQTLGMFYSRLVAQRRFNMLVLSLFGVLGVVISAAGIYGVMAYVVEQRTQEIGVRMALGAQPGRMLAMVMGRAMAFIGAGLVIGLAGAWALSRLVTSFLFSADAGDPLVYVGTAVLLVAIGLVAAWIPSRRAARVDPVIALRG